MFRICLSPTYPLTACGMHPPPGPLSEMHGSPAAGRQPQGCHCHGKSHEIGIDMGHLEVLMGIWDKYLEVLMGIWDKYHLWKFSWDNDLKLWDSPLLSLLCKRVRIGSFVTFGSNGGRKFGKTIWLFVAVRHGKIHHAIKNGKPSISMGYLYHGELLVITRWHHIPLTKNSQLGLLFPIYGKIKHAPNHQPVFFQPQKANNHRGPIGRHPKNTDVS